jgi:hypothetical protein
MTRRSRSAAITRIRQAVGSGPTGSTDMGILQRLQPIEETTPRVRQIPLVRFINMPGEPVFSNR